jgi:hypothetical protein
MLGMFFKLLCGIHELLSSGPLHRFICDGLER